MNMKLIQLKPDENIIAVYRRYGWAHLGVIFISFVLLVLPFFLLTFLFSYGVWGMIGFFLLLLIAILYSLRKAVMWYDNVFVVTSHRVVDVDQKGFFNRTVSEFTYSNIQDVAYNIKGLLATIFRVGTVIIRPVEGSVHLELRRMKHPARIVELINEHRDEARGERRQETDSRLRNLSDEEMAELVKMVKERGKEKAMKEFFKE